MGTGTGTDGVFARINSSNSSGPGTTLSAAPHVTNNAHRVFSYHLNVDTSNSNATLTSYEDGAVKGTANATIDNQAYSTNSGYIIGARHGGNDNYSETTYQEILVFNTDKTNSKSAIEGNMLAHYKATPNACTAPAGTAGEVNYNFTDGIMQYCNGSHWVNTGPKIGGQNTGGAYIPKNGLIGHWPLNGDPNDISGNGYHGVMKANASFVPKPGGEGQVLQTVRGSGETGCMTVNIPTSYFISSADLSKESSGALWVMFDDRIGENNAENWQSFMGQLPSMLYLSRSLNQYKIMTMVRRHDNAANLWPHSGNNLVTNENEWYHIAWSHKPSIDGSGHLRWYIDGQMTSETINTRANNSTGGKIRVGCNWIAESFNIKLSQFLLYDRAITDEEVASLYEATKAPPEDIGIPTTGLVGHWTFDDGAGTTAADSSGNGHDGTLTNMDAATDWTTGIVGGALEFDGSNDSVDLGRPAELEALQGLTLSAWIYNETNTGGAISFISQLVIAALRITAFN